MRTSKTHAIELKVFADTKQVKATRDEFVTLKDEIARVNATVEKMALSSARSMRGVKKSIDDVGFSANTVVRKIRQMESILVGLYALKRGYDATLGAGHEFNKMLESELAGLKILVVQNLANYDAKGKLLSLQEKYNIAQRESVRIFEKIKDINPETPHNLEVTERAYKAIFTQLKKYKASLEDIAEITKKVSILGKAMGLESDQFVKTVDTAFSGNMKPSQMQMALNQIGITNEKIKEWQKAGTIVEEIKKHMSGISAEMAGISDSFDTATSNFSTQWNLLWSDIQKPIFDALKKDINEASSYLKSNRKEIENTINTISTQAIVIGKAYAAYRIYKAIVGSAGIANSKFASTLGLVRTGAIGTSIAISRIGTSLKALAFASAPMIAITAAFEAWNYFSEREIENENKLHDILSQNSEVLAKMSKIKAQDEINTLKSRLQSLREETQELYTQVIIEEGRSHTRTEESIALRAKIEDNRKITKEIKNQIYSLQEVVNGTYEADSGMKAVENAAYAAADGVSAIDSNLESSINSAFQLAKTMVDINLLKGKISKSEAIDLKYNVDKTNASKIENEQQRAAELAKVELSYLREKKRLNEELQRQKDREMSKLLSAKAAYAQAVGDSKKALSIRIKEIQSAKGVSDEVKRIRIETIKATYSSNEHAKAIKASAKSAKDLAKEQEKAAKAAASVWKEYYEIIGDKKKVAEINIKETMDRLRKSGLFTNQQLQKANKKLWDDFKARGSEAASGVKSKLMEMLDIDTGTLSANLFENFLDSMDNFASSLSSQDPFAKSRATGELITSSLDTIMPGLGTSLKVIGAMLSTTLSEAEIKAAAGKSTFDTHALTDIRDTLEKYQAPQLTATRDMLDHIKSMDDKFGAIANAISSTSGFDFDGSNFTPTSSSNFWGGHSTELVGAGLKFGEASLQAYIDGLESVEGYQAIKETSSSFFGLVSNESIKEISSGQQPELAKQIGSAIGDSVDAAMDAVDLLGFDYSSIKEQLDQYVIDLGKINFKDMSAEEQSKALSDAISGQLNDAFSYAIDAIVDPQNAQRIDELAQTGEEYTATLVRLATQQEIVNSDLKYFTGIVADFAASDALVQAAGGLDEWMSAQDTFINRFLSEDQQKEYYKNILQTALATYDVAIPASKEQFIALKNETEAKIVSVKASISAMKAEIAAKVEAGQMSLQAAYGELDAKGKIAQAQYDVTKYQISSNNALIDSAHNAGKAAVSYGASINNSIKAMAGAATSAVVDGAKTSIDAAGNIDYSRITSSAIQAAEAELANLEGLYGTLMNNMGAFADYYDGVSSSASSAASALGELTQRLYDIASFKAELADNKVESARIILDATTEKTGLGYLTLDNILGDLEANMDKLTKGYSDTTSANNAYASSCNAVASSCSLAASSCGAVNAQMDINSDKNKDLLQDYKDQYAALKAYHDALIANKRGFEDLQMLWTGADSITVANVALSRAVEDTKLLGVNSENFIEKMNAAMAAGDDVEKWKKLSDALRSVSQVYRDMAKDIYDLADHTRQAVLSIGAISAEKQVQSIEDAINKQDYKGAASAFDTYVNTINGNNALTQKEKIFRIADANAMVQQIEKKNTNEEVVKELQKLRAENEAIRAELKKIEYNTHMTNDKTGDFVKVVGA